MVSIQLTIESRDMVKFFKIIEKIVWVIAALAIIAALAMMIIGAFVNLEKIEKELLSYMPYFYIGATIVLLYKIVVLVFTSFYQIKIEKRKDYLDVILSLQKAEESSAKQGNMLEQELTPFIENVKRLPEGNTDAVIREIQDRLPEVVQKLVDQRVAEIKQNIAKENEERIQEINVLSANVSDVLERREHLLNLEAEIKRCQEEEQKRRLAKTEEYTMLVFSLAGTSVENVEKVCDSVKLFIETGQVAANKDLYIPLNKKLRNAELKQFVTNIKGITKKTTLMVTLSSKLHSANGSVEKKRTSPRTTPCCPKTHWFQRKGWRRIWKAFNNK